MFQELEPHLSKVNMVITLQQKKDKLLYSITLKGKDDKDLNIIPLVGTATAAELDEAFPGIVEQAFGGSNGEAIANIVAFGEALKRKAEADKATAAAKTTTKTTTLATTGKKEEKKEDKPLVVNSAILKGEEQKAWKKVMEFVNKAKNATDPDMINFLEKSAIAEAEKVKSQAVAVVETKNNFAVIRIQLDKKKEETPTEDGLFSSPVEVETDKKETTKQIKEAQKEAKVVTIPEQPKEEVKKETPAPQPKAEEGDPFGGTVAITSEDDDTDEDEDDEVDSPILNDEQQEEAEDDSTDAPVDIDIF